MFLDGHTTHLTYHLSVFCAEKNIVLVSLPSNCTHILQPLDVAVFGPLKKEWASAVRKWRLTADEERLTKFNFALLLRQVMDNTVKPETVVNGFRRCGLSPFNPDAVDYTKCDILNATSSTTTTKSVIPGPEENVSLCSCESRSHKNEDCLAFFEQFISKNLLEHFNEAYKPFTPIWLGDESAHDLYVSWKKAKDNIKDKVQTINDCTETDAARNTDLTDLQLQENVTNQPPTSSNSLQELQTCSSVTSPQSGPSRQEKLAKVLSPGTDGQNVPSPFKKNLFWPGTPTKTKKGVKKTKVKLPAVISSKEWQDFEEKRRERKKKEQLEKEERKKKREESKTKTTKPKKKLIFDKDEDWTCKVCSRRYSSELILKVRRRWIECDVCKSQFHYKCIPKLFGNFKCVLIPYKMGLLEPSPNVGPSSPNT